MRRHLLTGVISIAALAVAAAPAGAAHAHRAKAPACPPPAGKVVAANIQATLYEATPAGDIAGYLHVFGCVRGVARRYDLGNVPACGLFKSCDGLGECSTSVSCGGVRHEVLAGSMVAFESFQHGPEEGRWYVVVRNLRNGQLVRRVPTGTPLVQGPYYTGVGPIESIVLKSDGSAAWLADDFDRAPPETASQPEPPAYYDIYAAEGSTTRLLAAGTDIDPTSLALAGGTVYWTQAGKSASAQLK